MLHGLINFLVQLVATLAGGACLLRAWLRWRREPWRLLVIAPLLPPLTDWLLRPIRQVLRQPAEKPDGRLDVACLLAVLLLELLRWAVVLADMPQTSAGVVMRPPWAALPLLALVGVPWLAISLAKWMVLLAALATWLRPGTDEVLWIDRLTRPLLAPARRLLPPAGRVDWSPLAVLLALHLLTWLLQSLQGQLLLAFMAR